ncbi:MAG: hypothetical protein GY862_31020, partial [Gammaproteobacteria bacterium]|nr:hypothetical protein [Gammaproteobacteria bacterium]
MTKIMLFYVFVQDTSDFIFNRILGKTMRLTGKLIAESPIYRGNARKTLFTRDGTGTQRLVSLAGEVEGTAEALMDAFIGRSRSGRNIGLLNRLWMRLYGAVMPDNLIIKVRCELRSECYTPDRFFDLRMGLKLDEDRWASEANANYKMETLFRHSVFDFNMDINDGILKTGENSALLYYVLKELEAGRFWFGAGKSKGLGRCRLELDKSIQPPRQAPVISSKANHLTLNFDFKTTNPVLVGWNWGKVDQNSPAFTSVDGKLLLEGLRSVPEAVRERLSMAIGGPVLTPDDWKKKLAGFLPRAIAAYLREGASQTSEAWVLPAAGVNKLGKAKKHPLSKKTIEILRPHLDQPFPDKAALEAAFQAALGDREAKKNKRILELTERRQQADQQFPRQKWEALAEDLGLNASAGESLEAALENETEFQNILSTACEAALPQMDQQIDQQIKLLQSDTWIEAELESRQDHLRIKQMLRDGQIVQQQWGDPKATPEGVKDANWHEFINAHRRVQFRHMLNAKNLNKSIVNDQNVIKFLKTYRSGTRIELAQPGNMDFRGGGEGGREISRKYGKPYDNVFMRMLSWSPSGQGRGLWEIYIPGGTIKGGFRKRATQVLNTLWGESARTTELLNHMFGTQQQQGLLFFSDAYLADPTAPQRAWCSMDGVRMDPATGRPIEQAKSDYLYAYGSDLCFQLRIDLADLGNADLEALSFLNLLIQDFHRGDIPLGGAKTSGFGWVEAQLRELQWLSSGSDKLAHRLFGQYDDEIKQAGIWQKLTLSGDKAKTVLARLEGLHSTPQKGFQPPLKTREGFISHRAFGGHCGTLMLEAEVLTPVSIQESGEPSYTVQTDGGQVNGWDFFSLSPPEAGLRTKDRRYALPSKTLKGMVRHLYSIASNSARESMGVEHLNPADSLFGFVGQGINQALMGRVAFSFGLFENPQLAWFKTPYPYGDWKFENGRWKKDDNKGGVSRQQVAKQWRVYQHAPLAPCVEELSEFTADSVQADYRRAIQP